MSKRIMFNWLSPLRGESAPGITATVEIYTWQTCPYCIAAKFLLFLKGVNFKEYKIDGDGQARTAMAERAQGKRSVPQIFINEHHIGGCTDLYGLEQRGELQLLLQQ